MADPGRNTPSSPTKHQPEDITEFLSPPGSLHSGPDTSEPQHPETESPKAHERDQSSNPRVRWPVEEFIKDLLEFVAGGGKDTRRLFDIYDRPGPDVGPCVFRDGDIIYSLLPSLTTMVPDETAFEKDEEVGCLFCRFDFAAGGNKTSVGIPKKPHYFLPLGYLVEKNIKTGVISNTYYAPCLNVTDEPVSLWLVYDYPAANEDADDPYQETSFGGIYDLCDYGPYFLVPDKLDKPSGADQLNETPAFPRGLFQSLERFDFAEVSEDICKGWIGHSIEGLDPFKVRDCMRRTLKTYGGTLRAVETWPKPVVKEASN